MSCQYLGVFFDGELPPEQWGEIRLHLSACCRCQQQLHTLMQLEALHLMGGIRAAETFAARSTREHPP